MSEHKLLTLAPKQVGAARVEQVVEVEVQVDGVDEQQRGSWPVHVSDRDCAVERHYLASAASCRPSVM